MDRKPINRIRTGNVAAKPVDNEIRFINKENSIKQPPKPIREKTFLLDKGRNPQPNDNIRRYRTITLHSPNKTSQQQQQRRVVKCDDISKTIRYNSNTIECKRNRITNTTNKFETKTANNGTVSTNDHYQENRNETSKLSATMNTNGHVRNMVQKLNGSLNSGNESATSKKPPKTSSTAYDSNQTEYKINKTTKITAKTNGSAKRTNETRIPNRKAASDTTRRSTCEDQLNIVGVETLYALLCNKHLALQKTYHELQKQLMIEQEKRKSAEETLQDAKLCEEHSTKESRVHVQQLQHRESQLVTKVNELQEQNELLEFRLLELEYVNQSPNYKHDKRIGLEEFSERDDISDSGVISLSPCEDFFNECDNQDYKTQEDDDKSKTDETDLGEKLSKICHYLDNTMDRCVVQRAIELIKQYEIRITGLETTLAHMCQERIRQEQEEELKYLTSSAEDGRNKIADNKNQNRQSTKVVATVPPYTDNNRQTGLHTPPDENNSLKKFLRDVDCLQESGIFDEFDYHEERISNSSSSSSSSNNNSNNNDKVGCCRATQTDDNVETDYSEYVPDLSTELSKLCEIKQRLQEERECNGRVTNTTTTTTDVAENLLVNSEENKNRNSERTEEEQNKRLKQHFAFYKEQYEILRDKLAVYEAADDDQRSKQLSSRLEREVELTRMLKRCNDKINRLQQQKQRLEEEKCEFEEAENDARLKCQKLEVKLYALMEKKNDLQFQLQQSCRTISNLKSTVDELEKKLSESYSRMEKSDRLINEYEELNFELEEREIEARYRLQFLESAIPAIVLWHIFRIADRLRVLINSRYCIDYITIVPNEEKNIPSSSSLLLSLSSSSSVGKAYDDESNSDNISEIIYCQETQQLIGYSNEFKIKQSDVKEKIYDETLQQADEIIAAMESEYRRKLNELETLLQEKTSRLERCERKIEKISNEKNRENLLIDKLQSAEIEVAKLQQSIRLKEEEKLSWMVKERNLKEEIESLNTIITQCKEAENITKKKLETEKNLVKQQKIELEFKQSEITETDRQNSRQLKQLQNQISRLTKDVENYEVTNSELREEVDTLENVIDELKKSLHFEKDEKEKIQIELSQELANRQKEIDELNRHSQELLASSTADEINLAHEKMKFCKSHRNNEKNCHVALHASSNARENIVQHVQNDSTPNDQTDNACILPEPQITLKVSTNVQNYKNASCAPKYTVACNLNKPVFKRLMQSELAFNLNSINSTNNIGQNMLQQDLK